jgi:hypothetical protein
VERPFLTRAALTLAIVLAGYLLVRGLRDPVPAPQPAPSPVATPLDGERPQEPPAVPAATPYEAPAPETSPSAAVAPVAPVATPAPQASPSPSTAPTPDPAEAQRAAQEQRLRAEVAAAKAKADSLSATANAECPDLKPGEMRHPGAVTRCVRLRSEAAQAVSNYETVKQMALAAGVVVQ